MARRTMALLLAGALLLTACSKVPTRSVPNAGGGATAANPDGKPALVNIRVLDTNSPLLDALITAYYAKYPGDRIEKVLVPPGTTNYPEFVQNQIRDGKVDVVTNIAIADLIAANLVAPLDPYIAKSHLDLKPLGSVPDQLKVNGKIYDLPVSVQPQVIAYNKDMFQAVGATLPREDWTWEDFRQAAVKLTKGSGAEKVWGFSPSSPDGLLSTWVAQNADPALGYADDKAVAGAVDFFASMIFGDQSMPKADKRDFSGNGVGFVPPHQDFAQGKAAMSMEVYYNGLNMMPFAHFTMDVAPVPAVPGQKPMTAAGNTGYAMAANAKEAEGAWRFISFAAGPEGAKVIASAGMVPLYVTPEAKKAWFDRQPAPPAGTEAFFSTNWVLGRKATAGQDQAKVQAMYMAALKAANLTWSGAKTKEDALADYRRDVQAAEK